MKTAQYLEAIKWYRKAAEQGHVEAQYNLGNMYFRGETVKQDRLEAIKWYKKVAEQNNKKYIKKYLDGTIESENK